MTKRTLTLSLLASLAVLAIVSLAVTTMPGCQTKPVSVPTPVPTNPIDTLPPPPQPDVGECVRKIESMQGAVSIAKIGAAILVSKDSKYGPAVKIALLAIDGALAEARIQCGTGNVDKWQVALAAFDKAFAGLVLAGDEYAAATAPNDIMPPPPYAWSLEDWNARVFAEELNAVTYPEPVIE